MGEKRLIKRWVIVNFIILLQVPLLFILGLLWPEHWGVIFNFMPILLPILLFHIFYHGFYVGLMVSVITICILAWQLWRRRNGETVSILLLAGEICVILFGIFDICPMFKEIAGELNYLIPGW